MPVRDAVSDVSVRVRCRTQPSCSLATDNQQHVVQGYFGDGIRELFVPKIVLEIVCVVRRCITLYVSQFLGSHSSSDLTRFAAIIKATPSA